MKKAEPVEQFVRKFAEWAGTQPDILALALVGSRARGAATEDSDVDLIIISNRPEQYVADLNWTTRFGDVERDLIEDYVKLMSVRVWYRDGLEVEYGITGEEWAGLPLDEGTRRVISGGMLVLFERGDMLSRHQPQNHRGRSVPQLR